MSALSQYTIIEGLELISGYSHEEIDRILMRFGIERVAPNTLTTTKNHRLNQLINFLRANPNAKGPCGADLAFEIIEYLIGTLVESLSKHRGGVEEARPRLMRALERDGFIVDDGVLKPMIPSPRGPAVLQSELMDLLDQFRFATSRGHLEQANAAHTRGEWASANAQLRSFAESLFDEIATRLDPVAAAGAVTSEARRRLLATISPPFFLETLNEWDSTKATGFIQGFWRRLHPQGSHPGLSSEDDSTFRLHLVQLVAHHLMKRLAVRLVTRGNRGRGV
ncbi:MAG: hypothetical protein ACJ76Y_02625 [Thermoanaerobaculia bacterium]